MQDLLYGVSHLNHSSIRIQSDRVIYFDPFKIVKARNDADVIFISHIHHDHFSIDDIRKLLKQETILVMTEDCAKEAAAAGLANVFVVAPSKSYDVKGLKFETVPACNQGKHFHKRESSWVGYVVRTNNATYYFAGDTDMIPEMRNIKTDVAFLPVGGTYTMTAKEAAEAANIIKPQIAVPIHYADIVGTKEDAKDFLKGLNPAIQGAILLKPF